MWSHPPFFTEQRLILAVNVCSVRRIRYRDLMKNKSYSLFVCMYVVCMYVCSKYVYMYACMYVCMYVAEYNVNELWVTCYLNSFNYCTFTLLEASLSWTAQCFAWVSSAVLYCSTSAVHIHNNGRRSVILICNRYCNCTVAWDLWSITTQLWGQSPMIEGQNLDVMRQK